MKILTRSKMNTTFWTATTVFPPPSSSTVPILWPKLSNSFLMNVEAKRELKIVEKLFALPEVREVHAVHGSIDILAKIALTRDLITSDAEVIGQFVHAKARLIDGIISTQTLIPGASKIKNMD